MEVVKIIVAVILVVFLSIGCRKDKKQELPPATQEGNNTMGCRVNGAVQSYSGVMSSTRPYGVDFSYTQSPSGQVKLIGGSKGEEKSNVFLYFYANPLKADTPYKHLGALTGLSNFETRTNEYIVKLDDPFNFVMFSRIDNQVAAGTFQFKAYSSSGEAVVVTEGRFDIARD